MKYFLFAMLSIFSLASLHSGTEFSQDNAAVILKHLAVEIGPRPMGSPSEQAALAYAVNKFREYGCDTSYVMPMTYTSRANTTSGIAVGIKHGATQRIIVIGGHIDSAGPEIPGADDDGSGSAVVIECARTLGQRPMQSTIVFCCFGVEEQGLEGSNYFVDHFSDIDSVALMLQVDMANGLGILEMDPDVGGGISAPAWLPRAAVEEFSRLGYEHLRYPTHFFSLNYAGQAGAGSDHESFLRKGVPAIDFSTDVAKPIHTPRDNFENFDPRGLKRSGDLVLKLAERFDSGVLSREVERYWLYLIGTTPIFIPIWALWTFVGIALTTTIAALIAAHRQRKLQQPAEHIRWSGLKVWLFSLTIIACGWFSSDVIGLLRGLRHPWFTAFDTYYLLAFLAMIIGGWITLRLARRLRLAPSSFEFAARSLIMLVVFLILLSLVTIKLTVEPAVALLLISLAIIVRQPVLKLVFLVLSPWWMIRLVFSEWDGLVFRSVANAIPTTSLAAFTLNGGAILFFSLYLLPFLYASVAVIRDAPELQSIVHAIRSPRILAVVGVLFIALTAYLLATPVYNELWYRDVRVNEEYNMNDRSRSVLIKSSEYLSGLRITHEGKDTAIVGRTMKVEIQPAGSFDTSWVTIGRNDSIEHPADSVTSHRVRLTLAMTRRPYTVAVSYSRDGKVVPGFETRYKYFSTKTGTTEIDWYSFPDTILRVPVEFTVPAGDSVKETIVVTFDDLAYPMKYDLDHAYFLPRTKYTSSYTYRK
ncbi:MAG: M28 family peptidase [Ignavibacteriae bacterium]|nr:M28 family peptidase [Ignavibacteriota bacterium]